MNKELLIDMCEYVNENVCDYELTLTNNFVGRSKNTDPHGCGISIGEWGCDTKREQKYFASLLKRFIKAIRSYGIVCSDVVYEGSENVFVNIEYDDNLHIKTLCQRRKSLSESSSSKATSSVIVNTQNGK